MFFGYNTNGFAHHRLHDALVILAELGYQGVAITLDYHALNPFSSQLSREVDQVRTLLRQLNLHSVIETGSRFLLDPRRKHQPTLISAASDQRRRRLEFLCAAVDIAAQLDSEAVSFWSGAADENATDSVYLQRLIDGCRQLAEYAAKKNVQLAFEPEPGMFIDTMARFAALQQAVAHPRFGLTIDIGHLQCQGELPIADHLQQWHSCLWNIHVEDMRRGTHDHLMFGDGEIDFVPVLRSLQATGYKHGVYVELSRHSHDAVETARKSLAFLTCTPAELENKIDAPKAIRDGGDQCRAKESASEVMK